MIRLSGLSLENAARRLAGLGSDRVLILLYHRVATMSPDPWSLAVTPEHFAEHLDILRRFSTPLSLRELARARANGGTVGRGGVVVTFDDGYADNLLSARPLLERYDVPATVFVSSGMSEISREFWWDELERVLLQPGTLPAVLELEIRGRRRSWSLQDETHYSESAAWSHRAWKARNPPPSRRHRIFLEVWRELLPLSQIEQYQALDQLARWARLRLDVRPDRRTVSPEEVRALASGGLVEVGAHTVTHPRLSRISVAAQQNEISGSRKDLEEILDTPVTSFAYPYGGYEDYTRDSVRIAREAGFTSACAAVGGAVTRFSDRYQLPRLYMSDMDGEAFARLLRVKIS
jgi:peptidoglycan/xylan/chitin deacetylase (PgdA/CDA1 family)